MSTLRGALEETGTNTYTHGFASSVLTSAFTKNLKAHLKFSTFYTKGKNSAFCPPPSETNKNVMMKKRKKNTNPSTEYFTNMVKENFKRAFAEKKFT